MSQTTLIKWPGGKSKEYEQIKDLIPDYSRYVEPFFGGGAVFFQLKPERAIINDSCQELIEFYRFIKNENSKQEFQNALYDYLDNWEKIPQYLELFENDILTLYRDYKQGHKSLTELKLNISRIVKNKEKDFSSFFAESFALDPNNLLTEISKNLYSKITRIKKLEKTHGNLPAEDLHKNIETALRSGFYMHFRDLMNKCNSKYKISLAKKIANYYFIREFCYGSMFRFNASGEFNIPYGGIAYNQKDFRSKVDYILSDEVEKLFKNVEIHNSDFQEIITKLGKNDFMFLDPPYDSDFSNYQNKSFGLQDQERLAECIYVSPAKFILVIKKTDFIEKLYQNKKNIKVNSFKKTYLYNVRGRNERQVEHLVIYNF